MTLKAAVQGNKGLTQIDDPMPHLRSIGHEAELKSDIKTNLGFSAGAAAFAIGAAAIGYGMTRMGVPEGAVATIPAMIGGYLSVDYLREAAPSIRELFKLRKSQTTS